MCGGAVMLIVRGRGGEGAQHEPGEGVRGVWEGKGGNVFCREKHAPVLHKMMRRSAIIILVRHTHIHIHSHDCACVWMGS